MFNVLFIHTHDTGRYIQPYGYHIPTPNLMDFAQKGTLFRKAFSAAPTCSPSRSAMLTGTMPHVNGMLGLAHRGFSMTDYRKHMAHFLNQHGYETVLCGVQHESNQIEDLGYQKVLRTYQPGHAADAAEDLTNAKEVAKYLRAKETDTQPFFLSYGLLNTHRAFPADCGVNPDYVMPPYPLPDLPETRQDFAAYMGSAQLVDQCVGEVLEALRDSGKAANTLVVFTTDHGIAFPMMKCNLYDTGIGVSFIVDYPGNPAQGKVVDALVSQLDLFPTVCDICQLPEPDWLEGKSLIPLLNGQVHTIREEVFAEVTFHAAYEPMRAIRTDRYKLICLYDDHDGYVPANIDDSASKDILMQSGILAGSRDREMLFDLYLDPVERINRISDPAYQQIYQDLSARLHTWMASTGDPLLGGAVAKPSHAIVNTRTCISPQLEEFE
ncbi:sulfatase [Alicyclobacillus fodiniaquatilis]|jgi:arylsulfatase A-like enzyme|uniref:Sulfatase n=1 Tax=Alicyclobacillus fodiniaquatilis TaxID=1661150 RepID=A0ABW4JEB9_9BACL